MNWHFLKRTCFVRKVPARSRPKPNPPFCCHTWSITASFSGLGQCATDMDNQVQQYSNRQRNNPSILTLALLVGICMAPIIIKPNWHSNRNNIGVKSIFISFFPVFLSFLHLLIILGQAAGIQELNHGSSCQWYSYHTSPQGLKTSLL